MSDAGNPIAGLFLAILVLAVYFLPTVIGVSRQHNNLAPIFLLNLLLGWTLVGWVVALAWSVANTPAAAARPAVAAGASPGAAAGDDWLAPLADVDAAERQQRLGELMEGEALAIRRGSGGRVEVVADDGVIGHLDRADAEKWARHVRQGRQLVGRVHALGGGARRKAVVRIMVVAK